MVLKGRGGHLPRLFFTLVIRDSIASSIQKGHDNLNTKGSKEMEKTLQPSKDEFVALTSGSNLIPVYQEILADMVTPISVFRHLANCPYCFFLESVEGGERWSRFSFMGMDPMFVFKGHGTHVVMRSGDHTEEQTVEDPLHLLENCLGEYKPARLKGLPRFFGGAVGYMGYETVSFFEPIPDNGFFMFKMSQHAGNN